MPHRLLKRQSTLHFAYRYYAAEPLLQPRQSRSSALPAPLPYQHQREHGIPARFCGWPAVHLSTTPPDHCLPVRNRLRRSPR
ncbi:hypothetical protein JR65_002665 [Salmonella enterica]|nr:hypothetical protein [Salmonella enterica subsp. enterica serovar Cairina]EAB9928514.1 hypothetical protein [Salmonella enterica subsp. enterica serovar Kua]EAM8674833.1 hypothetical protein [Salmonella enterica]EBQ9461985.1 hypothetical protein [Salmonella enterica subsp. enterica serovar Wangata]EBU9918379.1 hypothetical protein [Salmonella enterica subsp. enterica serovar Weybridge]EBX8650955.1 hypothetical protein [Salmonella enterica subsp. enterica serovar Westhampton]ECB7307536.1 hy